MLVASCVGNGEAGIDRCAGWRPIKGEPQDADVISDRLFLSIKAHNEHYAQTCEAKP